MNETVQQPVIITKSNVNGLHCLFLVFSFPGNSLFYGHLRRCCNCGEKV